MASIDYVVLTWNSAATLELTLSSIRNYGRPNRIIVVDKHSTDRTTAIAGEYGCDIISSGACLGAARRLGAREARADLVAFVDSDVELLPEWEEVLRASVDGRYPDAGVIGALYNDGYLRPITDPVSFLGGNGAFGCSVTRCGACSHARNLMAYRAARMRFMLNFWLKKACGGISCLPTSTITGSSGMSLRR